MADLGALPGYPFSRAYGVNDTGQAVGESSTSNATTRAFCYSNGTMSDMGLLGGWAWGINAGGQVVGEFKPTTGSTHAFLSNGGAIVDLGTFGGAYSSARGINDAGQVVGLARDASGSDHAFLYYNGTMTDLRVPFPGFSHADAINDAGVIAGQDWLLRALLYKDGTTTLLTIPGYDSGRAADVNNHDEVVGAVFNNGTAEFSAFLYRAGVVTNLNTLIDPGSGWWLRTAAGINDSGWIVGSGTNPAGQERAFLLIPVPEPSVLVLATTAVAVLFLAWRRHNKAA